MTITMVLHAHIELLETLILVQIWSDFSKSNPNILCVLNVQPLKVVYLHVYFHVILYVSAGIV